MASRLLVKPCQFLKGSSLAVLLIRDQWGFPKIRGTILGVPIIRTVVYWGLYWGPLILGNYQVVCQMRVTQWFTFSQSTFTVLLGCRANHRSQESESITRTCWIQEVIRGFLQGLGFRVKVLCRSPVSLTGRFQNFLHCFYTFKCKKPSCRNS